jgi:SMI1 / KNR4 family (SUKH-1)
MTEYHQQIQRIKDKLLDAKKADKKLKVFGADRHKYAINKPSTEKEISKFENEYSIKLPECYRTFILHVGNGGISFANSAAGPYFGVFPFGEKVDELIYDKTEKYLKNDCVLYPKMTDEYWKSLTFNIDDNDDISDEDLEKEVRKIYAGILPIGSQGCTYLHGIVLNGQFKGRVVNLDIDRQKPQFTFENNFLDWYERWLDEVIYGDLVKDSPSWFGYNKGGPEEELLTCFTTSNNSENKKDCLIGLLNKNGLKPQTINEIEHLIPDNSEHISLLIELICKSNYTNAKPYLLELSKSDLLSTYQIIYYHAKNKSIDWLSNISENIVSINDYETFRFCTYLLKETDTNFGELILPFVKNDNENIRVQTFYTLGQLKNKKDYLDYFIEGLNDKSNRVIHSTLQALTDVKDRKLLEHYRTIAEKNPVEQDYILVNLNLRLAEYGLTNKTILNKNDDDFTNSIKTITKKWYELWK